VSLTEISAVGRTNMELRQPEMLEQIHKLVVPGGGSGEWPSAMGMLDDWIMINIESNEARQK
jgi:glutamine amidotransferase PdxT